MTFEESLDHIGSMKYDYEQITINWPEKTKLELLDLAAYHREKYFGGGSQHHEQQLNKVRYILCLRDKYGVTK